MEIVCFEKTCVGIVVFVSPQLKIAPKYWQLITILTIVEIAFMIVFTTILTIAMIVFTRSSLFHPNMMRMAAFLYVDFYFYVITRAILLFYQFGVIKFLDYFTFEAFIIIFASMLRVYTAFSIVFVLVAFEIERCFASIFVRDYETNHRSWIAIISLAIVIILSIINSCDITFSLFKFPGVTSPIILCLMMFATGVMSICLFIYNKRRLGDMMKRGEKYTFTERYQLDENIRAFKYLLVIAITATLGGCLCFLVMIFHILISADSNYAALSGAAFDALLAVFFNVWLSVILFYQPVWREEFISIVSAILRIKRKEQLRRNTADSTRSLGEEGDVYFRDLSGTWDAKFNRKQNRKYI